MQKAILTTSLLVLCASSGALAQNAPADTSTRRPSHGNPSRRSHHTNTSRLNMGGGLSSLSVDGKTALTPSATVIWRIGQEFEVEGELGFWKFSDRNCGKRTARAGMLSAHREVTGNLALSGGAFVESANCDRDSHENERVVGLMIGPSYALKFGKGAVAVMAGLAITNGNHHGWRPGLMSGIQIRSMR